MREIISARSALAELLPSYSLYLSRQPDANMRQVKYKMTTTDQNCERQERDLLEFAQRAACARVARSLMR